MLEATKKRHIDTVELHFRGPAGKKKRAIEMLQSLGFVETSENMPWREAFPEMSREKEPGYMLQGARHREGLTQRQLAGLTDIPQRHISEMENGKRPIGKERARKLAQALNADYRVFL